MMIRPSQMGLVVFHQPFFGFNGWCPPRETDMTCLDHLIIAVDIFCILLWVVYPAHSCPKKCVAQHVSSSDARGSKVCFTGRIGWIAPLPTICRSFFQQETVPYQCSFTQLLDANIIFSNQESLPGYSWGGCGKSYAFTRFTTTAI